MNANVVWVASIVLLTGLTALAFAACVLIAVVILIIIGSDPSSAAEVFLWLLCGGAATSLLGAIPLALNAQNITVREVPVRSYFHHISEDQLIPPEDK